MGGKYVTLVSAEGFEYVVDYEAACVSNTIKNMLSSLQKCERSTVSANFSFVNDSISWICAVIAASSSITMASPAFVNERGGELGQMKSAIIFVCFCFLTLGTVTPTGPRP